MTQPHERPRQFSAHARDVDRHHARLLEEASFEAAAVAYVEDFHPPLTDDHAVNVAVREIATGHERCFRIDLNTGDVRPCV
jgi:Family of unknown function (DUF5961)